VDQIVQGSADGSSDFFDVLYGGSNRLTSLGKQTV
jgi:hypothetical protein